jgi:glycerol-3-phosphate cytidylyltransferase-like family protein
MYGNTLITIVATSKNRQKTTGNTPQNSLAQRGESLALLQISDIIEEGSENNPIIWLEKYSPKIICL